MANKKTDIGELKVTVPIEWYVPEGVMTPFASNIVVQLVEDVFKISFFESKIPIQLDATQPPPSKIRADCVTSVIITPNKLSQFIGVLQEQLDKYKSKKQAG
ncbi:MAG: hypothetical protein WC649_00215 [Desulfobacteria bacterium]